MLQSLATMMFSFLAMMSVMLIARFIRHDWAAVRSALGLGAPIAPLPQPVRALPARSAAIVRIEMPAFRRAA